MLLAVKFTDFIVRFNVIVGIICAAIGLACILLARRVTQAVDKTDSITTSSKTYVACKIAGLILILIGMILIALPA